MNSLKLGITFGSSLMILIASGFTILNGLEMFFTSIANSSEAWNLELVSRFIDSFCFLFASVGVMAVHGFVVLRERDKSKGFKKADEFGKVDYRCILRAIDPLDALFQWTPIVLYYVASANVIKAIIRASEIDWRNILLLLLLEAILLLMQHNNQDQEG